MGSRNKDFTAALQLLEDEKLAIEELVSHRLLLGEIHKGLELMRNKEACKVILYPNGIV